MSYGLSTWPYLFYTKPLLSSYILLLNLQLHDKGTAGIIGSSGAEHGSSWAVEVGGHLKVCSIIVENLNKSGQMLVEVCIANRGSTLFCFWK